MSLSDISIVDDVFKFTVDNIQTDFEINFEKVEHVMSIHIGFSTQNLSGNRKKVTSSILYELKQNNEFISYIKRMSHDAIMLIYDNIEFKEENTIWTKDVNSYYSGCKIKFTIATTKEASVEEIMNRFDNFIDNYYCNCKTGYCDND